MKNKPPPEQQKSRSFRSSRPFHPFGWKRASQSSRNKQKGTPYRIWAVLKFKMVLQPALENTGFAEKTLNVSFCRALFTLEHKFPRILYAWNEKWRRANGSGWVEEQPCSCWAPVGIGRSISSTCTLPSSVRRGHTLRPAASCHDFFTCLQQMYLFCFHFTSR